MRPEPVEGQALVAAMDRVREVCSTASALRKAEGLRVRLPLRRLTVAVPEPDALRLFTELITDELNVRELVLTDLAAGSGYGVRQVLQVNARAAGPRLGRDVQTAIKAAKAGDWSADAPGAVTTGGIALLPGEYEIKTVVADADPDDRRAVAMLPGGGFVILDTEVTPDLAAEGLARDVVRAVQQARRDAGLQVSDRIALSLSGDAEVTAAVQTHAELIKSETLATSLSIDDGQAAESTTTATVGAGQSVLIALARSEVTAATSA